VHDEIDPTTREWVTVDETGYAFMDVDEACAVALGAAFETWLDGQTFNADQLRNYRNRVYEIINRPLPDTLELAVRNEFAKSSALCDFAGPLPNFYSKESPLRLYVGKEIYYLSTSLILLENGFFDRRRRQHGGLVDNYIGRAEVIADRWQAAGLGPIATGQPYEFKEIDLE
jgi:hypothetical protein